MAGSALKPYYEDADVTLYHGKCEDVLPHIDHADLVVTSPPYNKGRQSGDYANMRDGYASYSDDMPDAEYLEWQQGIISQLWRITGDNGAIFYNHKPQIRDGIAHLPTRYIPDGVNLRQVIIWDRGGGMNWNPRFFVPRTEWVLLLAHEGFKLADRSASNAGDIWRLGIDQDRGDGHPCAFPKSLPSTAIVATESKVILDPFAGSGTTLFAARDHGRKSIGVELDESYCEIIAKRLQQGAFDFEGLSS